MTKTKKPIKKKEATHRIDYESWFNSQLSIVRFYGSCTLHNKHYVLDYDSCTVENGKIKIIDGEERYFPDLVTYE